MNGTVEFVVYGDYALFTDPIFRTGGEKSTYPVPTYEAIKGVLASIYWKPTFTWVVDKVRVMKPIRVMSKGIRLRKYNSNKSDLSCYSYLCDCMYQVQAHMEWNMNRPELAQDRDLMKHLSIFKRSLKAGGRRDVFLGTRECQAYVEECKFGDGIGHYDNFGDMPLGVMLHGITYADEAYSQDTKNSITVRLWRPVMRNGIIEFIRPEDCEKDMCRKVREGVIKVFGNITSDKEGLE